MNWIFRQFGLIVYATGILAVFTADEPNTASLWILYGLLIVNRSLPSEDKT